jgi:thiol-disulfide isomerase/thioredoxin
MFLRASGAKEAARPEWNYYDPVTTGSDGTARLRYDKLQSAGLIARDARHNRMAIPTLSPASLAGGEPRVALEPECRVTGSIVCEQLRKAGKPVGWTNVYLMRDGRRVASCDSSQGKFEFLAPPGTYRLYAYGSDLGSTYASVTVPPGRKELAVPPVALTASKLVLLQGKPAPELAEGVVGWKGKPVKLADLKGKYVLLDFWGYWCGPCVHEMPVLFELHQKFAGKGLAIVGIHMDRAGEVDTAAKLDEKLTGVRKKLWKGKDLPFPVALVSGKRVAKGGEKTYLGPVEQYGVSAFPTTVLIDRAGKVVGQFHVHDSKSAMNQVEKLLKGKK